MAKPQDWDALSRDEKYEIAMGLLNSARGSLIMGQALAKAVATMRTVEPAIHQERSNIEDMEMLGEALFPVFFDLYRADVL